MFRDKSKLPLTNFNLTLHAGGLGDGIAQMPALDYIFKHHDYNNYHLWSHDYLVPLYKKCFGKYNNVVIRGLSEHAKKYKTEQLARSPYAHKISNLSVNIVDHAFYTLLHKSVENTDKNYIKMEPIDISKFKLPKKYMVMTTGFTSNTREWLPESVNGVTQYIIDKGYTPVYIGKSYTKAYETEDRVDAIKGNFKCNYDNGINLIDKTDLFEAHSIMANATCVLGLDNGLMHLAAMSNVPLIIGFTTVDPSHRLPYRYDTKGWNCYSVTPTTEELSCTFCQSNMNFAPANHDFRNCFYKDYRCLELMSADKWIIQIEKMFNQKEYDKFVEKRLNGIIHGLDISRDKK
jgi:ADP-heptose:LPS heptosyltransferase